jgi:hypothetical protein
MIGRSSQQYAVSSKKVIFLLIFFILATYYLLPTPIHAQSVDILWQGETYTSPFYEGKSLWSNQSKITLVAIPQGLGNSASLNYKWSKNGTVLGNVNGVGRNTISFYDTILSRPQNIRVDIISNANEILANASVTVVPTSPVIIIYENNPLYGFMFHREVSGTYTLKGQEVTFTAFPLFFSTLNRTDNSLKYEWRTNVGEVETKNSVTYRIPSDATGSSQIQAQVSNQKEIAQSSLKNFLIKFEN